MASCPTGYLFHWSSMKLIHPKGGSHQPKNDTYIVIHSDTNDDQRLHFRFVPKEGVGHFGYIEHVSSRMVVHPSGGKIKPSKNTRLVLHHDRHAGALFAFDEDNNQIIHKGSGMIWHSNGGKSNPKNDTKIVLHSDRHDAAKFYFGKKNTEAISPYPPPVLSGEWELVRAFLNPSVKYTYKVGMKESKSEVTESSAECNFSWKVSSPEALELFSSSVEFSALVKKTTSSTWNKEKDETLTISVEPGKTVVVWQYVFGIARYDKNFSFLSSITENTDSLEVNPTLKGLNPAKRS